MTVTGTATGARGGEDGAPGEGDAGGGERTLICREVGGAGTAVGLEGVDETVGRRVMVVGTAVMMAGFSFTLPAQIPVK